MAETGGLDRWEVGTGKVGSLQFGRIGVEMLVSGGKGSRLVVFPHPNRPQSEKAKCSSAWKGPRRGGNTLSDPTEIPRPIARQV